MLQAVTARMSLLRACTVAADEFGECTYESIYQDLLAKDESLYTRNGLLQMLRRNAAIKPAPQRWQNHR